MKHYGVLWASLLLLSACNSDSPDPVDEVLPVVSVITLATSEFSLQEELPGRVAALRVAEVRPQVRGIIEKRFFEEGSDVKAGDLLYQINRESYAVDVARASANLAVAKASLANLRAIAERHTKLLATRSVSQQDYDVAQANYQQGLAQVESSQAELDAAEVFLTRTQVRAPISGRIGRSAQTEGALVSADQQEALATIQQFNPIYVDIVQSSQQLLRYKRQLARGEIKPAGARVSLILEDGLAYEHQGILKFTELNVDPATGVVSLRAQFPNSEGILLPGMYVRAHLKQGVASNIILVPQQAIHYNERNQPQAWILDESGQVALRDLTIVGSKGNQWAVSAGLEVGERLIVEGSLRVYPGAVVSAVEWSGAANLSDGETQNPAHFPTELDNSDVLTSAVLHSAEKAAVVMDSGSTGKVSGEQQLHNRLTVSPAAEAESPL